MTAVNPPNTGILPGTLSHVASPTLPITPTTISISLPTSSLTSASTAPTTTAVITLHAVENMTTCGSGTVTWDFSGSPGGDLSILVMNVNDTSHSSQYLSTNLDPASETWTWSKVNVSQGWYDLEAYISYPSSSDRVSDFKQFYISNGTDTSCLLGSSGSNPASTPSTSSTALPVSGLPPSRHTNVGAIVGGVLGGLAGLFFLLAAFLFFRTGRPSRTRARSLSAGIGPAGGWGGLNSGDDGRGRTKAQHLPNESVATVAPRYSPAVSESELNSVEHEKMAAARGFDPVTAQALGYNVKRSSTTSSLASTVLSSRPPSTSAHPPGIAKRNSQSRRSLEAGSPRRVPVPPISYMPPSHVQDQYPYPPSPQSQSPEPVALSRSASTGNRRTPRKPVPKYDAAEFTDAENEVPTAPSSTQHQNIGLPELNHKSSFGEKKMHYILPDMPPSAAE
ncbi:hypothetical protein GLOTRDRAFT_139850 [Gloeophyllum trabeum ATCC 11539]|uniref:Uncharacterized protein n=1 Tax=Gloeophyllum trabeum (strain ATCC 11539 / FP-39264 / Madison 617) TaxID=670483 RepID=S7Q188_GLOTA|nr:uncharacterized protein GLOTRDRAFT_139850 [Gloeophyllum trabeum ATCC 11539]EPQ53716.1 hypothetical protein GLOTRDRAFT_139850 [Gloeophyllum trabeum ATCC 11539]